MRRTAALLVVAVLAVMSAAPASAQLTEASTSRASKDDAIRRIPWSKLNQPTQEKLSDVVSHTSIYRRMPMRTIECEPEMFIFLVRYPEVVVNIWEIMGVSNVNVRRTGDYTFSAADASGTTCDVELIYGSPTTHILYASAVYEGSMLPGKVTGECVLLLESNFIERDGRTLVTSKMDMFVKINNIGADLIARTLSPMIGKSADFNFTETADFISRVSVASQTNHIGVNQLAAKLDNCQPAVRTKFSEISSVVSDRYMQTMSARAQSLPQPMPSTDGQQPYPYQINAQGGDWRR